jgi:hypothetical protein
MADKKNKFDELNQGELKDVKGGIPYEPPDLVELSSINGDCDHGLVCRAGSNLDCTDGADCRIGRPKPDPQVP